MARDKELKMKAADELTVEDLRTENPTLAARGPESSASPPAGAKAPALKTANFVDPAWRSVKYITPEVFRRRIYAYFGHGHSKSAMHRRLHSGRIRAVRVGNRWLIPESTWQEFLERCQDGEQF